MPKKILVLDDDNNILELLTLLLVEEGYEIMTVNCGKTVFADIKSFKPDLLLMDVILADMDGRAICREIKEHHLTCLLPVILISGTHDLAESLKMPGAPNDFIAKPFDIDHLLLKIKQCLPPD